jgi:hypothetical protein
VPQPKRKLKAGEKFVFGFSFLVAIIAIGGGIRRLQHHEPAKLREYYNWTQAGLDGHFVYRSMGCNNCHRAMGVGEVGLAPVLDGEGTRRTRDWLERYFQDPGALVEATAHDGRLGPDFRSLKTEERAGLVAFLYGLKSNPGSPNYPKPPIEGVRTVRTQR